MRLHLIAVGKLKPGPERTLFEHFAGRLVPPLHVHEVEVKKPLSGAELKQAEAKILIDALPKGATLIALDERGRADPSGRFAERMREWRDRGVGDLVFMIGGADGLDESVRTRAAHLMAFGPMTWPHMLVRGLLAEQLFRCQAILSGHPYHRE